MVLGNIQIYWNYARMQKKKPFVSFPGQELQFSKADSGCRNSGNASSEPC